MKLSAIAAIAALGVALSGCATIVDGTHQSVSVNTTPVQDSQCTLTNSQGTWYLKSPGSVEVHKTKTDLHIACTHDGYQPGDMVAVSKFGGATFGNIIAGGLIGAGVDAASGANYYYDTPITVPLGAPVTSSATTDMKPLSSLGKPNS
jgi:hypothetical protein